MNHQPSAKIVKLINSCIQIKSTKINRRTSIIAGVDFCLDRQLLAEIEQVRASNSRLELDSGNLATLRHYALRNLLLEYIYGNRGSKSISALGRDSTLIFTTQYSPNQNQSAVTLMRSAIDLEGRIAQQIRQQLLDNSLLLEQISAAHYWLIDEILAQLPLRSKAWYAQFTVSCFYLTVAIVYGLVWSFVPLGYLSKIVICSIVVWLSKLSFKLLITQKFKAWIIYHLLDGFLAQTLRGKQISINLLRILIALYHS